MQRKIVITGASSVIGRAVCRRVLRPADEAIIHCCRNLEFCRDLTEQLECFCRVTQADFSDAESLEYLCALAEDADILINCAAITRTGPLADLSEGDLVAMVEANVLALVKLCRAVLPGMVARRGGCIVNISSSAATRGNRGEAVYAGTKGFMEAFTRSLAAEYGPQGVRVNCVAPGLIDAGSLRELRGSAAGDVMENTALQRLGTPDEVAAVVAFLCGDDASFISGRTIGVDGGFRSGV